MEEESGQDRMAALADMRFKFITALCEETVVHPSESRERIRSKKIDHRMGQSNPAETVLTRHEFVLRLQKLSEDALQPQA